MLHPEPMPVAAVGSPPEELDTSCLGCFSRRIGLIVIAASIVLRNAFGLLGAIELMTLGIRSTALAISIIHLLILLVDTGLSGILLLGVRDGVVRTRLNIWLVWMLVFTVLLLILFIVVVSAVKVPVGLGVLTGLQLVLEIVFRVYGVFAGWRFREELMSAPPPPSQIRPETGDFSGVGPY